MSKVKFTKNTEQAFEKASTLLDWNKKSLSCAGLWPVMNKFIFFAQYYYFAYHLFKDFVALFFTFSSHSLIKVVGTGLECISLTQVYVRFWTLKNYSKELIAILDDFGKDYPIKNYKTEMEKKVFLYYNSKSKMLIAIDFWALGLITIMYYFQPLLLQLRE